MGDENIEEFPDFVEEAQRKIDDIRKGSAFVADFECARYLERCLREIKILSLENKILKKRLAHKAFLADQN